MTEAFQPNIVLSCTMVVIGQVRDFYIEKLGLKHMIAIKEDDGLFNTAIIIREA